MGTGTISLLVALTPYRTGSASSPSAPQWSAPASIGGQGPSTNQVAYAVSCPSTTFCVAVNGRGNASYRRARTWSSPRSLRVGGSVDSVSCSSARFCVAMGAGRATTYDGHAWSVARAVAPPGDSYHVSCPSATFCAAVGTSDVARGPSVLMTYNGRSWKVGETGASNAIGNRWLSVSCATSQFCMATNFDGQILRFTGTRWTLSQRHGPRGLISVSCTVARFCMAVTITGGSVTFRGEKWSSLQPITGFQSASAYALSCASATTCSVIGLNGDATNWRAGRWSRPSRVFAGGFVAGVAISCPASNHCVAVNDRGLSATN